MILIFSAALGVFLADQASKIHIQKSVGRLPALLAGGCIRIGFVKNAGLILGLGKKHPRLVKFLPAAVLTVTGLLLALLLPEAEPPTKLGLGLLLGGGAGNVCDRFRQGYVTDFINFPRIKKFRNLYFNLADFGIFIGAILTCVSL